MKILQINAVYNLSSTGKLNADFQNYVNSHTEHTCKTAFSYGGTVEDGYIIGSDFDRRIHGFLSRLTGKQAWYSKQTTKNLINYIDEYSPDIIQLGNLHGNYINFPMLVDYIAKKDIATVFTLHDCWAFTGRCTHYTIDKCYKWKTGCFECPRLSKDNNSWFIDKSKELWQEKRLLWGKIPRLAMVGVSQWILDEAKKSPLMENVKIFKRIYNSLDSNTFKPVTSNIREQYGLTDKKIILGVSPGWIECKGIFEIIELCKVLPDDYQIVLVGKMSSSIPKGNIIHIPATEDVNELAKWYSAADVFITMSMEETFGKVSAEALLCGTPVVCLNSTASPELIGDGCGYVCKSNTVEEFKDLVIKVVENGKDYYSDSCIKFARENFNTEKNLQEYLNLYEELLKI